MPELFLSPYNYFLYLTSEASAFNYVGAFGFGVYLEVLRQLGKMDI